MPSYKALGSQRVDGGEIASYRIRGRSERYTDLRIGLGNRLPGTRRFSKVEGCSGCPSLPPGADRRAIAASDPVARAKVFDQDAISLDPEPCVPPGNRRIAQRDAAFICGADEVISILQQNAAPLVRGPNLNSHAHRAMIPGT